MNIANVNGYGCTMTGVCVLRSRWPQYYIYGISGILQLLYMGNKRIVTLALKPLLRYLRALAKLYLDHLNVP